MPISSGLIERVAEDTYVGFDGIANGFVQTPRVNGFSAAFDGVIESCQLPPGSASPLQRDAYSCPTDVPNARVRCLSQNHRFVMMPR